MIKKSSVIAIIGGTGFLGHYITHKLAHSGARIKVISRHAERDGASLKTAGAVGQIALLNCNVLDAKALEEALQGCDYVVNCVGIAYSSGKQTFENIHIKFIKSLLKISISAGVKHLIHISADIDAKESKYSTSKSAGEEEIRTSRIPYTILKLNMLFGPEDGFMNLFNTLSKISPILPLIGGGKNKLQPVYVGDVAQFINLALTTKKSDAINKTFHLAGPKIYTMKEMLQLMLKITHRKRVLLAIPYCIANIKAFFFEFLPKPLITREQVKLLKHDIILHDKNGFSAFDLKPKSMEAILPTYLD